jgi:hypothetical protein
LDTLGLAMGLAWTSGLNLYATVAALGLASRMGLVQLPPDLLVLADPLVIAVACLMYVVEFFADKVPYIDNGWDLLHTFIRVPAGALLAARALGEMNPALELAAMLAGGTVALAAHGTKAAARVAINASPEPISNWFASIGEDLTVLFGIWLVFQHPLVMLALVAAFVGVVAWLTPKLYRLVRRGLQALWSRLKGAPPTPTKSPAPPSA